MSLDMDTVLCENWSDQMLSLLHENNIQKLRGG